MVDLRFLIIESDSESGDAIKDCLVHMGYMPERVDNITRGIEIARSGDFDVLIAGLNSSNWQETGNLKQIIESGIIDELVVVTDEKHKEKALNTFGISVWAYCIKPLNPIELKVIVNRINEAEKYIVVNA